MNPSTLSDWAAARRAEYDSHVRREIRDLAARGQVTWEEYRELRLNSYERETLYPALTNEALARVAELCLNQCQHHKRSYRPATTYDEAVIGVLAPLLIERLRTAGQANSQP